MTIHKTVRATREMGTVKTLPGLSQMPLAFRERALAAAKELARGDSRSEVRQRHGSIILEAVLPYAEVGAGR